MKCDVDYESIKGHEIERAGVASIWVQSDGRVSVTWKLGGHFKLSTVGLKLSAAELRTLAEELNLAADELDGGLNMGS